MKTPPECAQKRLFYRNKESDSGFTLVELLTVVAIVAILVTLSMPVYQSFQESSQRAKCVSNLRQIGAGIQMVVADGPPILGPGYFPFLDGRDETGRHTTWYLMVAQKLGLMEPSSGGWVGKLSHSADIFCCPANKKIAKAKQLGADFEAYSNLSYGYHDTVLGSTVMPGHIDDNVLNIGACENPAKLIVVTDSNEDGQFDYQISDWGGKKTWVGDRHKGGANTLFADGHVEWVNSKRFGWGWIPERQRDGIVIYNE